jgi:antitoxin component of MazEF toxin-antitoxin module
MVVRKVLLFKNILGLTLPKRYTDALDLRWHDQIEVYLTNEGTILLQKHQSTSRPVIEGSGTIPSYKEVIDE